MVKKMVLGKIIILSCSFFVKAGVFSKEANASNHSSKNKNSIVLPGNSGKDDVFSFCGEHLSASQPNSKKETKAHEDRIIDVAIQPN